MKRITIEPRSNWTSEVEKLGYDFYEADGVPCWQENAYYEFTSLEIDVIEKAADNLHSLCLLAAERIVNERLYPLLGIDPEVGRLITKSWEQHEPAIYGRFDLIFDGQNPPKMLEYNADTPTTLFESSIIQRNWREQQRPKTDQFNNIHKALVSRWCDLLVGRRNIEILYVTTATPMPEDEATVQYIGSTAQEAGYKTKFLPIQDIGWDEELRCFVDLDGLQMRRIFKLYPWEWIMRDDFGANIPISGSQWLEPIWKMLLSNKGILSILWEMFPEHENLLPAYRTEDMLEKHSHIRKPLLGRQGNNITIYGEGKKIIAENEGPYTESGYIYQSFCNIPQFDGYYANVGAWMINDKCCGMGIREDKSLIISNKSTFVPHIFTQS